MKTSYGIELDITKSKYIYAYKDYIFHFSSPFYLSNFTKNVSLFRDIEAIKIRNKYNIFIDLDLYLTFVFYKKIEKRGFYVTNKNTNEEIREINFISNLLSNKTR